MNHNEVNWLCFAVGIFKFWKLCIKICNVIEGAGGAMIVYGRCNNINIIVVVTRSQKLHACIGHSVSALSQLTARYLGTVVLL